MSQPTLDTIEAAAMNALSLPEPETLPDSTAIIRNLAQVVLDLAQYIRAQERKAPVGV
jgi:hypothetical protein